MSIFSKRFLLPLFFAGIMFMAIFRPYQVVKASEEGQVINSVSVEITDATGNASQIHLRWQALPPVNVNESISYTIVKSTDGGFVFNPVPGGADITALTWTDNNVPNYTNVIYQVRSKETVSGLTTTSSAIKVFPPIVNVHDNYMVNTDLCSSCHATHTAKTTMLLSEPASATGFCITCHDAGSTNSKYDVSNGNTMTAMGNKPSLGGAFKDATSAHSMECANCHSAHSTDSYRMLKSPTIVVAGAADNPNAGLAGETAEKGVYGSGVANFCLSCHTAPVTSPAPIYTADGHHDVNTALASGAACLECHFAHASKLGNLLK